MPWLKAHKWWAIVTAVLVGLVLWQGYRMIAGTSVAVETVRHGNLVESIVASGHVETPYRVAIGSQMTGTVVSVAVREGQAVKIGQLLVRLDSRELDAEVAQVKAAVVQAEAHMRQMRELVLPSARATQNAALASQRAAAQVQGRVATLASKGFATRAALDEAQKNLDVARSNVRTAAVEVQTASLGGSDYVGSQTELAQARASLDTVESRLGYTRIIAPRDGVLINRAVEQGNVVSRVMLMLSICC